MMNETYIVAEIDLRCFIQESKRKVKINYVGDHHLICEDAFGKEYVVFSFELIGYDNVDIIHPNDVLIKKY